MHTMIYGLELRVMKKQYFYKMIKCVVKIGTIRWIFSIMICTVH